MLLLVDYCSLGSIDNSYFSDIVCQSECILRKLGKIDENGFIIKLGVAEAADMYPLIGTISHLASEGILRCHSIALKPNIILDKIPSTCNPSAYKFITCFQVFIFNSCPEEKQEDICLLWRTAIKALGLGARII